MIYDTFMFFNELELLEIRLHELAGVVDRFVLVEATRTHSNRPKPLHYAENRARYAAFADRIIHVVVEDTPDTADAWEIERFQRDGTVRGLRGCRPDDLILVSDVDEIPRAAKVAEASRAFRYDRGPLADAVHAVLRSRAAARALRPLFKRRHPFLRVFEQTPCAYYLNCISREPGPGTRMLFYRDWTRARDIRRWRGTPIPDGGWHFTCLGGVEALREKIAAFAHQEYNTPDFLDPERLAGLVERGEYAFAASGGAAEFRFVEIDDTFPAHVVRHPERFAAWIKTPAR